MVSKTNKYINFLSFYNSSHDINSDQEILNMDSCDIDQPINKKKNKKKTFVEE